MIRSIHAFMEKSEIKNILNNYEYESLFYTHDEALAEYVPKT